MAFRKSARMMLVLAATLAVTQNVLADAERPQTDAEKKGIDYLVKTQDQNGGWLPQIGPGVTALVTKALLQSGKKVDDPVVAKALAFLDTFRQQDGGYYQQGQMNYNTACTLAAFAALPADARPAYADRIAAAQKFLKSMQRIEGTSDGDGNQITKDNPWYGGWGYSDDRPDISNTAFSIDALRDTGVPADDPAIQKALTFATRSQLNAATNAEPWAKGETSGGFLYTTDKAEQADESDRSKPRTYGSLTYAGLKVFIYAGLTKNDPRVLAALQWIKNHWTLDTNPGTGGAMGLYYYYHTFAKTMELRGEDEITDAKGVKHDWRKELETALAQQQNADGSWVNKKSKRWFESNPLLVTAYATLSLQEARKPSNPPAP
jgi:squalene-hopene/tetraprenyl-beta-curcumene cyclase